MQFLKKSQYWTRTEIDNYQNEKLRILINHSYTNVPFYNELFQDLRLKPEDIQTKKDLGKLPIIKKDDLKRSKGKHLATNLNKRELIFASSSGSTGEPFQFHSSKKSYSLFKAIYIRAWGWMGYHLGDKYVKISMNPRTSLIKKIQDKMNYSLYLSSTQLSSSELTNIENAIKEYDPFFIRCYPVPLQFLAKQIKLNNGTYSGKKLIAITTTGSTLHDDVRKEIEDVFQVKIFDTYSCEGGTLFAECPTHDHYHPAEEYAISEFIEDQYSQSDSQHPLRHITTDLHNYASPFIRYDTQDYVIMGDNNKCKCGREFINIKKIKGRDSDILVTPSGKYLIVENFVAYFEWIQEVDQIQVVQEKKDEIIIYIVVNKDFNIDVYEKILHYWKAYIGHDVNLSLKIVENIKLTPTGKRRTVIRNPDIKLNG